MELSMSINMGYGVWSMGYTVWNIMFLTGYHNRYGYICDCGWDNNCCYEYEYEYGYECEL